ncbi:metal-dependent hydrolase family protein [Candidatus Halobonum tyrrellensis]|uniref:Amidohydrolase, imidazolonepropionase n=1 Tax=Candidatus Halobonum tyrrellensis G22 TaxID=1324957 RepID=V4HCP4_9EURY|nr:amidohydrolase family protein [Candidatus Halobonum tyrrellensis]ESP87798.1 amidohydrolase, imidazolonepropionase [Candidatus Halobonum tyrrellensis G22]
METRVVECGTLLDGESEPVDDARLVVEAGRVADAGPREDVDAPDGAAVVDHGDATVTPGLVDAHVHLTGDRSMDPMTWVTESTELGAARATADLRRLLAAGFTAVRDVGSGTGLALRDAVADGEVPGPRVYTSGRSISQTGGHGDSHMLPYEWADSESGIGTLADGADECRKEARKRVREGVDLIKIMTTGGVLSEKDAPDQSQFTDREIRAFTEEAHRVGIPVASHAQGAPGVKAALENGVDTVEHGFYLDEDCFDLFAETDATFVPTLSIMHRLVTRGADHGVPEYGLAKAEEAREAHFDATRRAYEAGVPIALGTDFIGPDLVPHGENALEAELFVDEIGMSEREAIEAGTRVAARTVPDDEFGTLTPGMRADFLAFEADPLSDVSALRDPAAVYRSGERVDEGLGA